MLFRSNDLTPEQHPDIDGLIEAIGRGDLLGVSGRLGNVLELVTARKYPAIEEIKGVMREYGALGAMMSGSGPTVFGLFSNPKAAVTAYEDLRYGEHCTLARQVYLTNFYNNRRTEEN